jgi:hypothetical protein
MRKPFDVFAEGLISKNIRGNWTPLEHFSVPLPGPGTPLTPPGQRTPKPFSDALLQPAGRADTIT